MCVCVCVRFILCKVILTKLEHQIKIGRKVPNLKVYFLQLRGNIFVAEDVQSGPNHNRDSFVKYVCTYTLSSNKILYRRL